MTLKAALIDLSGTLHVEDEATPNAVEALERLRASGVIVKFVTNTTKESSNTLYNRLCKIGFNLKKEEIYSSLSAAVNYIKLHKLNPYYLVSEDARTDFPPYDNTKPFDSVAIGLAPKEFHYDNLNKAFNILLANKCNQLIAIHQGKYYKTNNGLALGPGSFVKGLQFATGTEPIVIGKPNEYFFKSAIPADIRPEECVMIGDDANDDIEGAMSAGLKGILVKTGKYRKEVVISPEPTALVENFNSAVDWIISVNTSI
ncbi:haloacid dehalogenase-like hydrolase domain-containing protein 2 isoform X2 [Teleopsis dalmanni]|nr:haloacid dehalogenase-like hydrolase domain-containing protein 2 isoform X2 [Teleopsis dalmanni]